MQGKFHPLTVQHIKQLTPNSVAITLAVPKELTQTFAFFPGQYITIKKTIKDKEFSPAYSISSYTKSDKITIGIKRTNKGGFSDYANTKIAVGDVLDVMHPRGRFVFSVTEATKNIVSFAAGSGIGPIISIAKAVLGANSHNKFVLVYGNKSLKETMFYTDIAKLQLKYAGRFFKHLIFSQTREDNSLFGRIDTSTVNYILKNKHKEIQFDDFYLCGPEAMICLITDVLKENNIDETKIHFELFTTTKTKTKDEPPVSSEGNTKITVLVDDEEFSFSISKKTNLLDAILEQNIDVPYSCKGGVCSSCIARVAEGNAKMEKNQILTDSEIEEGLILTCQALATTAVLKVDFDDV